MTEIMLKVPQGTDWPVVGREAGTLKLSPGFLESVADASGLGLDWHHPERPALTDEMLAGLLDAWYRARREAGFPPCPYYEAMTDEVIEEIIDDHLPHPGTH